MFEGQSDFLSDDLDRLGRELSATSEILTDYQSTAADADLLVTELRADLDERGAMLRLLVVWFGLVFAGVAGFATWVVLARTLTLSEFGSFATALATVGIVVPLAGFGVAGLWLQIYGAEGDRARRWIRPSLGLLAITVPVASALAPAWVAAVGTSEPTAEVLLWLLPLVPAAVAVRLAAAALSARSRSTTDSRSRTSLGLVS